MKEARGNMLNSVSVGEVMVITTNGFVKANGECVMGRGIAKQIADAVPEIPKRLGMLIGAHGNHVHYLGKERGVHLVAFPVKPISQVANHSISNVVQHMRSKFKHGDLVPGWACVASREIINRSLIELNDLATAEGWTDVLCPRFGCGAGELIWDEDIQTMSQAYLDDRFTCMTF